MTVMLIIGSRSPEGQTARAAQALADGLRQAGVETETVFLPQTRISPCRQCDDAGWGLCIKEARCVIDDDLAPLVARMRAAEGVVFATPVYFGDLSESLKTFLDRLRRTARPEAGKVGLAEKPAIGICVAGGGGGGAPACSVILEKVLRTVGFDLLDVVPVRRQNLEMKLDVLRLTGVWLAGQLQKPAN